MIKPGVYCGKKELATKETHGGISITHTSFHHLCFYYPDKLVGSYNSEKNWYKRFIDKKFHYIGEITKLTDETIEFYTSDPFLNDRILYSGSHSNNQMNIVARRESAPDIIWLQDVFEYVNGTNELIR